MSRSLTGIEASETSRNRKIGVAWDCYASHSIICHRLSCMASRSRPFFLVKLQIQESGPSPNARACARGPKYNWPVHLYATSKRSRNVESSSHITPSPGGSILFPAIEVPALGRVIRGRHHYLLSLIHFQTRFVGLTKALTRL